MRIHKIKIHVQTDVYEPQKMVSVMSLNQNTIKKTLYFLINYASR